MKKLVALELRGRCYIPWKDWYNCPANHEVFLCSFEIQRLSRVMLADSHRVFTAYASTSASSFFGSGFGILASALFWFLSGSISPSPAPYHLGLELHGMYPYSPKNSPSMCRLCIGQYRMSTPRNCPYEYGMQAFPGEFFMIFSSFIHFSLAYLLHCS